MMLKFSIQVQTPIPDFDACLLYIVRLSCTFVPFVRRVLDCQLMNSFSDSALFCHFWRTRDAHCMSMLLAKTNVAMFTEFSSLSRRLTSLASSLWRWVRTRQRTLLRLNLWQELVAQAAPCGHILCSG